MCGIAGWFSGSDRLMAEPTMFSMLDSLRPRGPEGLSWGGLDDQGSFHWCREEHGLTDNRCYRLAMGCSRLAINDPSDRGLQPILSADETLMVVMNGEVFNFVELRQELQALGVSFRTGTDTEVVANGFQVWGHGLFSRLNGQFAIAVYHFARQELVLARDRVGITPLYFTRLGNGFVFASEIKALQTVPGFRGDIDHARLASIIGLPYKLHRQNAGSIYSNIHQVAPGQIMILDASLSIRTDSYWKAIDFVRPRDIRFEQARDELRSLLVDSVRLRLRTDRRLSFIVSGGIDSSLVLGIAAQEYGVEPETWSLDIPDARFNENPEIREVLDYNPVKSNFLPVTPERFLHHLPYLFDRADEPLATPNGVLHHIMASSIADGDYKVVLNGVGGDEGLFGYHDHFLYYLYDLKQQAPDTFERELKFWSDRQNRPLELFDRFERFMSGSDWKHSPDFLARSQGFDYRLLPAGAVSRSDIPESTIFDNMMPNAATKQVADLTALTIPHSVYMDDACYFAHSVEARQPFLDHRILEFGLSLPLKYKFHKGYGKFLLRSAVKGYVPASRRRDVRKTGLNLPIDVWMRNELRDWLHDSLFKSQNRLFDYADRQHVREIFDAHMAGEGNHSLKLWDLVSVTEWLNKDSLAAS